MPMPTIPSCYALLRGKYNPTDENTSVAFPITNLPTTTFGRQTEAPCDESNHIATVGDNTLSRKHISLSYTDQKWGITSLSKNGIVHQNTLIPKDKTVEIKNGDAVKIGGYHLYFQLPLAAAGASATAKQPSQSVSTSHSPSPPGGSPSKKKQKISESFAAAEEERYVGTNTAETKKAEKEDKNESKSAESTTAVATGVARVGEGEPTQPGAVECVSTPAAAAAAAAAAAQAPPTITAEGDGREQGDWKTIYEKPAIQVIREAVIAAGKSPELLTLASGSMNNTVTRNQICDWITSAPKFSEWVEHLKTTTASASGIIDEKRNTENFKKKVGAVLGVLGFTRGKRNGLWHLPTATGSSNIEENDD